MNLETGRDFLNFIVVAVAAQHRALAYIGYASKALLVKKSTNSAPGDYKNAEGEILLHHAWWGVAWRSLAP